MARAAGVVMLLILFSRLLGLVRERAIAQVFGMTWQTDVFRNAFNIPDFMFFLLVAGGLNAAFIPVFTSYLAKDQEDEAWRVASSFFTITVSLLVLFAVLGALFAPQLTILVGYGFVGEQRELLIALMRILFLAVFFTALAGLGMGIHRSYKSFTAPMVGPIAYNLAIIAGTYALARWLGVFAMAIGTVVGAIANFLIQLPFFLKKSMGRFRLRFDWSHPGIKQMRALIGPSIIALSVFQLSFTISANIASGLGEGSPSALRIANQLVQLPLGIFAMGMGTVLLPTLSELAAQREWSHFRNTFSVGLRTVLFVTIPAAFGLAVLREPIIRLLFEVGQFTAEDTTMTGTALLYYSIGLFAQAACQILMQVYFSLQDTRTLLKVSLVAIASNTGLAFLLLWLTNLNHGALALAWSLTVILNMTLYLLVLRKHIGHFDGRRILRSGVLAVIGSAIMACAAYFAAAVVGEWVSLSTSVGRLIQVITGVLTGAAVYGVFALICRMEEVRFVLDMVRRRRAREPHIPDS